MSVSPQEFLDITQSFREVTPQKAAELLNNEAGSVVFVGRETCPYCRLFVPKLNEAAKSLDREVFFVHSEHPDYTQEIAEFRSSYNVPTVPGLLYSATDGVQVKCDSSLSVEEITAFITQ